MVGSITKNWLFKKKIIKREDNEDYLVRYSILNTKWFSIKIHNMLISDSQCLHDHPWHFYSFILKGGYWEYTPKVNQHILDISKTYNGEDVIKKWHGAGSLLNRPAHWIHRIELPKDKKCWTFVITFKKTKDWGFFTKSLGFVSWKNYNSKEHCD